MPLGSFAQALNVGSESIEWTRIGSIRHSKENFIFQYIYIRPITHSPHLCFSVPSTIILISWGGFCNGFFKRKTRQANDRRMFNWFWIVVNLRLLSIDHRTEWETLNMCSGLFPRRDHNFIQPLIFTWGNPKHMTRWLKLCVHKLPSRRGQQWTNGEKKFYRTRCGLRASLYNTRFISCPRPTSCHKTRFAYPK